jgi:hypothetical protein
MGDTSKKEGNQKMVVLMGRYYPKGLPLRKSPRKIRDPWKPHATATEKGGAAYDT